MSKKVKIFDCRCPWRVKVDNQNVCIVSPQKPVPVLDPDPVPEPETDPERRGVCMLVFSCSTFCALDAPLYHLWEFCTKDLVPPTFKAMFFDVACYYLFYPTTSRILVHSVDGSTEFNTNSLDDGIELNFSRNHQNDQMADVVDVIWLATK